MVDRNPPTPPDVLQVKVAEGTLRGLRVQYTNNILIDAFRGIPYGKPATGNMRFSAPEPIEIYESDPLDCFKNGEPSRQRDVMAHKFIGSEDCLNLNVYSPSIGTVKKYPVMVWIYGGGFTFGTAADTTYSPEFLVEKGVVLVAINYRLGALGLLSYPEGGISGNNALKDQQLALKWISRNISAFGGDSGNVTLFGQSSGAVSGHLHLFNSVSRKLFHKLIMQSSCGISDWGMPTKMSEKAEKMASLIAGRVVKDSAEVVRILKAASMDQILKVSLAVLEPKEVAMGLPVPFAAVVETPSPTAFLTKHPLELMNLPNDTHPIIVGYNSFDGNEAIRQFLNKEEKFLVDQHYLPDAMNPRKGSKKDQQVKKEVKEFYYGDDCFSKLNYKPMVKLLMDKYFTFRIHDFVERHVTGKAKAPLFMYEFGYDGAFSFYKRYFQMEDYPGPIHGDDLYYLFGHQLKMRSKDEKVNEESRAMRDIMCELWTSFAKNGVPKAPRQDTWDPVVDVDFKLLRLNNPQDITMACNEDVKRRVRFWKDLHRRYESAKNKCNL